MKLLRLSSLWLVIPLFVLSPLALVAQDLTLSERYWVDQSDPPDTLPKFPKLKAPRLPEGLGALDEYEYTIVHISVSKKGKIGGTGWRSTHPKLKNESLHLLFGKARPARRNGKKVNSLVWASIIFNPQSAKEGISDSQPRLLQVSPVYAPDKSKIVGLNTILVQLTVTSHGEVEDITLPANFDEKLGAVVKRSLATWVFAPARKDGQLCDSRIETPVLISDSTLLNLVKEGFTSAVPLKRIKPKYPLSQRRGGYGGRVLLQFVVDIEGRVRRAFVVKSTNPAFDEAAITAVMQWKFKPAMKDGRAVNSRMSLPMVFSLYGGSHDAFRVQASKRAQKALPPELQFDTAPKLTNFHPANYPYAALLEKQRGKVEFAFVVDSIGRASLVKIFKSPGEEFSAAIAAMVDVMQFSPALKAGQPTNALLRMKLDFDEVYGDISVSDSARKVLARLRKKGVDATFVSMRELDEKLRPVSRRSPQFPRGLSISRDRGDAMIEFFVDKNGIAQLPHIISATDPAFGYAACQAIAAWRFQPPLSRGKPVVVRVRVPVKFKRE